ncbi:uncharacterized protein LOC143431778 [Xylocopa sonorina]|uniref:uncharacterized protein LOC143431778 n=1 Tax=Xylocopa sonorina TaxID=1818115 RepID=UPI00403ADF5F
MAANLGRLLPNLGGPDGKVRRLYAGIVRSMAQYGASVWSDDQMAATTLAVLPPLELLAATDAHVYRQLRSRQDDSAPPELVREALKLQARQSFLNSWWELLNSRRGSHRTFGAILPFLSRWVDRSHGQLTFRTTQVFTGHGCFGHDLSLPSVEGPP